MRETYRSSRGRAALGFRDEADDGIGSRPDARGGNPADSPADKEGQRDGCKCADQAPKDEDGGDVGVRWGEVLVGFFPGGLVTTFGYEECGAVPRYEVDPAEFVGDFGDCGRDDCLRET